MSNIKISCELCPKPARLFCAADAANLCWDCDRRVHSANFIVERHFRNILCRVCLAPTLWRADGLNLGPTVSVCHACSANGAGVVTQVVEPVSQESESDDGLYDSDIDPETDTDTEEESSDEEDEDEDDENQVVPWTETAPVVASSAVASEDDEDSFEYENTESKASDQDDENARPLKMRRTSSDNDGQMETAAIVDKLGQEKVTGEGEESKIVKDA